MKNSDKSSTTLLCILALATALPLPACAQLAPDTARAIDAIVG